MSSREIDAGAELDRIDNYGRSSLGDSKKRLPRGAKALIFIAIGLFLILAGFLAIKAKNFRDAAEQASSSESNTPAPHIGTGGRSFIPARLTPELPVESTEPPPQEQPISPVAYTTPAPQPERPVGPDGKPVPTPEELLFNRRLGADLVGKGSSQGNQQTASAQPAAQGGASGSGALAEQMQPVRFNASSAAALPNRDLLVTQGEMIDCQLETKIITTQAGQVMCYLTRDVYSTSKRVVMMEKGSKVVGQYQGGITQGQKRIFVLWTRVETNKGVIINLDSTGTGPLGEAGLGGWVDTHFWERFGGAMMLSVIDDVGEFFSRKASGTSSGDDRITFDNTSDSTQDMAAEALSHTINIPPTLYKNHGERVQIFVARDLDFSGVYSLERS